LIALEFACLPELSLGYKTGVGVLNLLNSSDGVDDVGIVFLGAIIS